MPISDCEVRDPRIRRTRQLLQGALRTLMQRKTLDEISVQDITDEATVNRVTFYDHYTDKFALLGALVGGGLHAFLQERKVHFDATCPESAGALILAICDYLAQSHSDQACDRHSAFEPLMDAAVTAAVRVVLLQGMGKRGAIGITGEMLATMASSAICGGAKEWLHTPNRPPAGIIAPQVLELVLPMLRAAKPVD